MGSIVSTCNKKQTTIISQDIYLSFDDNISEEKENKVNNIIQKIKGIYTKSYFEILKHYAEQIDNNNNNNKNDSEIIKINININNNPHNKNNNDNEINKNSTEEINNKE